MLIDLLTYTVTSLLLIIFFSATACRYLAAAALTRAERIEAGRKAMKAAWARHEGMRRVQ